MWERQETSSALSPLEQRRRLREAKLVWERRRREEERAQELPGVDVVAALATLMARSSGTQHEPLRPDWSDPTATSVSPLEHEPVLLEVRLASPLRQRPISRSSFHRDGYCFRPWTGPSPPACCRFPTFGRLSTRSSHRASSSSSLRQPTCRRSSAASPRWRAPFG